MLRLYGAAVGAAVLFASLILIFGAKHSREGSALFAATIWLAVGGLYAGFFYVQMLWATGAKRWVGYLVLWLLVLLPAIFIFILPRIGPFAFAAVTGFLLLLAKEPQLSSLEQNSSRNSL
jgi:hypothetical protein